MQFVASNHGNLLILSWVMFFQKSLAEEERVHLFVVEIITFNQAVGTKLNTKLIRELKLRKT